MKQYFLVLLLSILIVTQSKLAFAGGGAMTSFGESFVEVPPQEIVEKTNSEVLSTSVETNSSKKSLTRYWIFMFAAVLIYFLRKK